MTAPVIYVDLYQSKLTRQWRWRAKNAANNRKMANGGESYTNRQDCLNAIHQLFGDTTNVYLREPEKGNYPLRRAL